MSEDLRDRLRDELLTLARSRQTATYARVASTVGLDFRRAADANELAALLRTISEAEHKEGRPLLSAVCVMAGARRPGQPFFELAKTLGVMKPTQDPRAFFDEELARVYKQWAPA